jgi:hypothetical protein
LRKIIEIPVGDLMSAPALTANPNTTIDELTQLTRRDLMTVLRA